MAGNDDAFQECIEKLKAKDIRVVAFDMDQTAVSVHSHGNLRRDHLDNYLGKATPDFLKLVPLLHQHGFGLSIATHSDEAEFGGNIFPETHILGREIARALVDKYFSAEIASAFHIIAYNPRVRPGGEKEENRIKRYHVRNLVEYFKVDPERIVFLDDTEQVVSDCIETCKVNAFLVDASKGFQISDLLDKL